MAENIRLISILMNYYGGAKYHKEAIDSRYAQSYDNWEIIFLNNVSTGDGAMIAKSYDGKLKYFLAQEHATPVKARNLPLKEAKGNLCCLCTFLIRLKSSW